MPQCQYPVEVKATVLRMEQGGLASKNGLPKKGGPFLSEIQVDVVAEKPSVDLKQVGQQLRPGHQRGQKTQGLP